MQFTTKCLRIVGDSFSWVTASPTLRTLTLSRCHTGVQVDQQWSFSQQQGGEDCGSAYLTIYCECGHRLGKVYKATPRDLDHLRWVYIYSWMMGHDTMGETSVSCSII